MTPITALPHPNLANSVLDVFSMCPHNLFTRQEIKQMPQPPAFSRFVMVNRGLPHSRQH